MISISPFTNMPARTPRNSFELHARAASNAVGQAPHFRPSVTKNLTLRHQPLRELTHD
jgi:hypothetical protein